MRDRCPLPDITLGELDAPECRGCYRELLQVRHHSLYAPRDFDVSPFFAVVKPRLAVHFDYRNVTWVENEVRRLSRMAA